MKERERVGKDRKLGIEETVRRGKKGGKEGKDKREGNRKKMEGRKKKEFYGENFML